MDIVSNREKEFRLFAIFCILREQLIPGNVMNRLKRGKSPCNCKGNELNNVHAKSGKAMLLQFLRHLHRDVAKSSVLGILKW